jgi:hypothetical protein
MGEGEDKGEIRILKGWEEMVVVVVDVKLFEMKVRLKIMNRIIFEICCKILY